MYEPGPRRLGRPRGIMNVVYEHYINYLAERLSTLENEWRAIGQNDQDKRRMWLVEVGKVLHGIEDWFFHSNAVELIRLHSHKPDEVADADREAFVKRIIRAELNREPEFSAAGANKKRLERFFYRRLRFPVYGSGTRESTGGVASTRESTLNWDHAYPAFPSTLDTAHTLLGALEGLEAKLHPGGGSLATLDLSRLFSGAEWLDCVMQKFHSAGPEWSGVYHEKATARNVTLDKDGMPVPKTAGDIPRIQAWAIDVLRELVPLVLTLLHERERQRLVADVAPMDMPLDGSPPKPRPGVTPGDGQVQAQLASHVNALKPKKDAHGIEEHNYARAARYFRECGSLNTAGEAAIAKAFDVDIESEKTKVNADTPGAGGFLIKFAVKLQKAIDKAKAVTRARPGRSLFERRHRQRFRQRDHRLPLADVEGHQGVIAVLRRCSGAQRSCVAVDVPDLVGRGECAWSGSTELAVDPAALHPVPALIWRVGATGTGEIRGSRSRRHPSLRRHPRGR